MTVGDDDSNEAPEADGADPATEKSNSESKDEHSSTASLTFPIGVSELNQDREQEPPSDVLQILDEPRSNSEDGVEGCSFTCDEVGDQAETEGSTSPPLTPDESLHDDSSSDDGEGEWITPDNVELHKARALQLLPSDQKDRKSGKDGDQPPAVGCMTADFAMQNVLLQMGLSLISTDGKRIQKVKSWVLRCHACFK